MTEDKLMLSRIKDVSKYGEMKNTFALIFPHKVGQNGTSATKRAFSFMKEV